MYSGYTAPCLVHEWRRMLLLKCCINSSVIAVIVHFCQKMYAWHSNFKSRLEVRTLQSEPKNFYNIPSNIRSSYNCNLLIADKASMEEFFHINACVGNRCCSLLWKLGLLHTVDAVTDIHERQLIVSKRDLLILCCKTNNNSLCYAVPVLTLAVYGNAPYQKKTHISQLLTANIQLCKEYKV